jgi:hypothetical protein
MVGLMVLRRQNLFVEARNFIAVRFYTFDKFGIKTELFALSKVSKLLSTFFSACK